MARTCQATGTRRAFGKDVTRSHRTTIDQRGIEAGVPDLRARGERY